VFGLVHGAGFATYLQSLFVDRVAVPLLGFNLGIEAGQVVVLAAVGVALALLDAVLGASRAVSSRWPVARVRAVAVSLGVVVVAAEWAVARSPW
jgi:hypothetical protein